MTAPKHRLEHRPQRGSDVEQWLKTTRDIWKKGTPNWFLLDAILEDYRVRADYGQSLSAELDDEFWGRA